MWLISLKGQSLANRFLVIYCKGNMAITVSFNFLKEFSQAI